MKVLLICHRLPFPPDRGDRLLAYRTIEVLVREHDVHVLSFRDAADSAASEAALRGLGVTLRTVERSPGGSLLRTAFALLTGAPLQVAYFASRRMAEAARSTRDGRFDVVLAQMVRMAPYGLLAPARARVALLGDSLGLALARRLPHEPAWRRPLVGIEQARVARYEREVAARYDESWMVSAEDCAAFPAELQSRLRVVRNGFPPEFLALPAERPGRDVLLFVGHLGVPHNVDSARVLAREVLPRVRAVRPAARVRLVGADPSRAVLALAALPGVEVTGFVPDLGAEFAAADVFVGAPRFASGVQNKLLEAMGAAVPVVTSPIGARGLGLPDDGGGVVATGTDPAALADAVLAILADPAAALAQGRAARAWVRASFRWENSLDALADIGSRLAATGRSRTADGHASVGPEAGDSPPRSGAPGAGAAGASAT